MTANQYARMEAMLVEVERVTMEQPFLTPQGRRVQKDVAALLAVVVTEKYRAEQRDGGLGPTPRKGSA